jgi:TolB-like protein/DNA-binding winged helix-turn-helix (wHTH) protein/Tfp pilus assembly protein PilF
VNRQSRQVYEFGPFRLIPKERLLLRDNQPVRLTAKCFDLLVVLVESSGRLVEKEELMQRIWPDCFVEEANLSVNISTLRRVLGEGPDQPHYVQTVPRHGYRFVAPVKERWEDGFASPTPVEPGAGEPPATARAPRPRLGLRALVLGFSVLAALIVGLTGSGLRGRLSGGRPDIQALAVLPLEILSGDSSQDYLADGLTAALAAELAKIRALNVVSGPSLLEYRRTPKAVTEIGRELKVDAVLAGSVKRLGERVRIAVQLVHVGTDRSLWADSYERNLRDVVALQRAVTRDVARQIRIELSPQEQGRFSRAGQVDPQAYDDYLRGQYYLHQQTRAGNDAAIQALERAVEADPGFAPGHAELAQAYVWKLFLFEPKEKKWAEKAYVAAEKALALDPESAVAHLARGRLLWTPDNRFPHEKAIREYRRALALNPNLDEARNQLALVYCHIGAFGEALEEARKAVTTNPNNTLAQFRTAQTLNFQGKHEEALSILHSIPRQSNPALVGYQIAWALFNLGRKEEATATLAQLQRDYPEDAGGLYTSVQAVMAASAGQDQQAERKIRTAIAKGKGFGHFHHTAYHISCAYALMDQPGPAIEWLQAAAGDGFPCYPLFAKDANLDSLRRDPRFISLLAQLRGQWEHYQTVL